MIDIPVLETERLRLRCLSFSDWPDYLAFLASPRAQFMGGPHTSETAWSYFCNDVAQWQLFGHGALMFEDKTSSAVLGQVALCKGPLFPELELGWFIYARAGGRGYAAEAAQAMLEWGWRTHLGRSIVSYIDPGNTRSIKLAERLGATIDKTAKRPHPANLVYRHRVG
nr:GNAT family N-acetyltransferase [Marinicella sp. W31]MDC2876638.1 GNAT family N-acetyltransferase [Marinicella sp. W31]